jgi:hypothetical protein
MKLFRIFLPSIFPLKLQKAHARYILLINTRYFAPLSALDSDT